MSTFSTNTASRQAILSHELLRIIRTSRVVPFLDPSRSSIQFSIIPNNSLPCVRSISVVTGPWFELVSERKRHSRPQECRQSVPDWILTAAAAKRQYTQTHTTHTHTHTYTARVHIPWKRHETSAAWPRDPNTGESLDARCAARMEWNGMEVGVYVVSRICLYTIRTRSRNDDVCVCECTRARALCARRTVPALWD